VDVIVAYAAASLRNESSNYYCHGPGKKTPSWGCWRDSEQSEWAAQELPTMI